MIGAALLALLAFAAWHAARPFTWAAIIPLGFILYAAFRVIFELTFNRRNVPTLATSFAGRARIAEILKQEAGKKAHAPYRIIDLGSGRGELTRRIALAIPSSQVIGIEMARIPYWQSVFVQRWLGPRNLSYRRLDFWQHDCSDVDAVVFYLSGNAAQRAGDKLRRELKPGSLVVSHTFPLRDDWAPEATIHFRSPFKETIYVYRKTAP